jgi:hypothetical protein
MARGTRGEAVDRAHGQRVFCLRIGAVRVNDDPTKPNANPLIELDAEGQRNRLLGAADSAPV